jgi:hypothetical protein
MDLDCIGREAYAVQCPKCVAENRPGATMCQRCGIVFEKYYKYHPRPGEEAPVAQVPTGKLGQKKASMDRGLRVLLLPPNPKADLTLVIGRAAVWLLLLLWGLRLMSSSIADNAVGQSFLHLVNLPFHEAGHLIFRPFGPFMHSLGGTLGQLLMPAICCGVLLVQTRDPFGAAVGLWWLGENFLDIAPYVADARAGVLPLLGGNFGHSAPYGFHDWQYLLNESGLLHLDQALARGSFFFGSLVMVAALVWGGVLLAGQYRAVARAG